jgi:hypothetical protein
MIIGVEREARRVVAEPALNLDRVSPRREEPRRDRRDVGLVRSLGFAGLGERAVRFGVLATMSASRGHVGAVAAATRATLDVAAKDAGGIRAFKFGRSHH